MKPDGRKPDLAQIKRLVSFPGLMSRYGMELKSQSGNSLRGKCPLPTHTNENETTSFTATLKDAGWVWDCFSRSCIASRGGRKGGNIIDFAMIMEGEKSLYRIGVKLNEWFGLDAWLLNGNGSPIPLRQATNAPQAEPRAMTTPGMPAIRPETQVDEHNPPLDFRLQHIDHAHPYLAERGVTVATAEYFGVGLFPGRSRLLNGKIVVPIWNAKGEGNPVAYAGRSIDGSEPKYVFPPGFKKSLELWNLHRIPEGADHVVVLEGFFSLMRFHQAGVPNVVSLMGSSASEDQVRLLARFPRVTLCLDPDEAGRSGAEALLSALGRLTHVRVLDLPSQPDELPPATVRRLFGL